MSTKETKNTKSNLVTETFRLNKKIQSDIEIIEFLKRSNNKTGLVKDALRMYKTLVDKKAYSSPFLEDTETDWNMIFANIDP